MPIADIARRALIVGHANTFHDPAIALIEGNQIFAEAMERHTQCKRALEATHLWYSSRAIRRAVESWGLSLGPTDVTVLSSWLDDPDLKDTDFNKHHVKSQYVTADQVYLSLTDNNLRMRGLARSGEDTQNGPYRYADATRKLFGAQLLPDDSTWRSKRVPHHLAHAAHAVYSSPFDECVVMVIDGYGEKGAHDFLHFKDDTFTRLIDDTASKGSLGELYGLMTGLSGFAAFEGEEWKTMGLAAYGKRDERIWGFFHERMVVEDLSFKSTVTLDALNELGAQIGGFRHRSDKNVMRSADLAHNFQLVFEECVRALATNAGRRGLSKNLAFAGGCALNSSANGKLLKGTGFERLHVPCAPADDGNALGVALYERHAVQKAPRAKGPLSPYLGSTLDLTALERALSFGGIKHRKLKDDAELCDVAARAIADGRIIGWLQGRAEFGPRALGNRSILADPRPKDMKDRINKRVKFREEYRPLAPSILHEHGPAYFADYQESPYMDRALVFRDEVREKVPAVVHVDGTGRLQTVKAEWNPLFHQLISRFHSLTGIPLVLNTSFNVMGKPIVHAVEDALTVFFTTGLEVLFVGPHVLEKL